MPSQHPHIVTLRGDETYARALDRLLKTVKARGVQIDTRHQLAEYALTVLGLQNNLKLPPRTRPVGTNQHTTKTRKPE